MASGYAQDYPCPDYEPYEHGDGDECICGHREMDHAEEGSFFRSCNECPQEEEEE